jgi:hypothetical protein
MNPMASRCGIISKQQNNTPTYFIFGCFKRDENSKIQPFFNSTSVPVRESNFGRTAVRSRTTGATHTLALMSLCFGSIPISRFLAWQSPNGKGSFWLVTRVVSPHYGQVRN